jgi:predicted transcriptional regulator YheO
MESVKKELPFLTSLMKGLSLLLGKNCEIVLHDHKDQPYEHTIIAIENGHVTGRKIGDCGTNLGLEILRGTSDGKNEYNYITQTKDGRILRSSSIYIHDSKGNMVGALCINFDISDLILAEQVIGSFCQNPFQNDSRTDKDIKEIFVSDVNGLIDALIQEVQREIGVPVVSMTKEDKLKALEYLDKRGAFLIKKSGDKVAGYFDISKYTMYSYLESVRNQNKNG